MARGGRRPLPGRPRPPAQVVDAEMAVPAASSAPRAPGAPRRTRPAASRCRAAPGRCGDLDAVDGPLSRSGGAGLGDRGEPVGMKGWATTARPPASWMASTVSSTDMCIRIARSMKRATTWMPGGRRRSPPPRDHVHAQLGADLGGLLEGGEGVVVGDADDREPDGGAARTSSTEVTCRRWRGVAVASAALRPSPRRMRSGTLGARRCGRSLEDRACGAQNGDVGTRHASSPTTRPRRAAPLRSRRYVVLAEEDDAHEHQARPADRIQEPRG